MNDFIKQIELTPAEHETAMHLGYATTLIGTGDYVRIQGTNALMAREKLHGTHQIVLPNNQWHIEVSSFMAVSLARLQQVVVEYATASNSVHSGMELRGNLSDTQQRFCVNQKVRHSGENTSFSLLGMTIILVCGAVIIILSLVIDTLGDWLQGKVGTSPRQFQWRMNEKLQLQRLAYEAAGKGDWSAATDIVPVILAGHNQILGALGDEEDEEVDEEDEKVVMQRKHSISEGSTTNGNMQATTQDPEEEFAIQPPPSRSPSLSRRSNRTPPLT